MRTSQISPEEFSSRHLLDVLRDKVEFLRHLHLVVYQVEQDGGGHDGAGVQQRVVGLVCVWEDEFYYLFEITL